jgi:hypothetical protein
VFDETYSREFTVDVLDQEGAEFSKDLEHGWLWFMYEAHGGAAAHLTGVSRWL